MNSSDYRATALLSEHLGFAPLTLIDEVINDVNQIMYNCTDALERFLLKRREVQVQALQNAKQGSGSNPNSMNGDYVSSSVFPLEEIKSGAAELETLLVSHVDKNFDKFELYTLRNILTIPRDLVEGGWIRLKHHEGLDLGLSLESSDGSNANEVMKQLISNINLELQLRKILLLQKAKATKIIGLLRQSKLCIEKVISANSGTLLPADVAKILKQHLQPINENVYYLLNQVDELLLQVLKLNDKFMKDKSLEGVRDLRFTPTNRDCYVHDKTVRILEQIGILGPDAGHSSSATVLYSAYAHT
ncbi:putative kinetochore-associated protein [Clavispora lusitaniae]|uniref:Kinetochore-associated protein n=1 Tax=Clavispora lusitaniae TaxID=36911 RepID=A0ACD0WM00_CLALS|nr:hypothetical protein E0198_003283 [Clavispora lusitaniae]QFZ28425.1 putative kinetochore-associated protein [Clavispora lusitaniae]QFZ34088.1 putative kinetochore-associated protein [Clavispora lusitaniae]QFZ39772.1 putative kinetochore-associated protein [Clavispora lusitaniae]QFZ45454.1 putative kinetochore-associated protein [Clavispora lusitaniae]